MIIQTSSRVCGIALTCLVSSFLPHTVYHIPRTSYRTPHIAHLTPHTSHRIPHTDFLKKKKARHVIHI